MFRTIMKWVGIVVGVALALVFTILVISTMVHVKNDIAPRIVALEERVPVPCPQGAQGEVGPSGMFTVTIPMPGVQAVPAIVAPVAPVTQTLVVPTATNPISTTATSASGASPATTACADTGATWDKLQGKPLTVPANCEVWISSDPASFEVNGVKGESQTRWTLVATGPVTVTVSIPDQTHTHYHMGVVGSVDINNRDGAPNALIFKDGKFQPRPEKVR